MDNKKIALMTWYSYINYGSALQASALYLKIKENGYGVDFIKYEPKGNNILEKNKKYFIKRSLLKLKEIINPKYKSVERRQLFENFINDNCSYTSSCKCYPELHDLNLKYDAFICGSDQIWSPLCYDSKYFLDFVDDCNRMIAYAPSLGPGEVVNPIIREYMKNNIARFKYLSVREQQGANFIKILTGQEAKVVLDPTLLLDSWEWDNYIKIEQIKEIQNKEYAICYFLGNSNKYMGYVKKLSKIMKIPFYIIPVTLKQKRSKEAVPFEVGPREFVSLIRNAKYVYTDSFHGLAFSVNYNIPFSVFKRFKDNDSENQNNRIFNLLEILDLKNRLVDYRNKNKGDIQRHAICDFSIANVKLREKRKESIDYLKNALESALAIENQKPNEPFKITDVCCGCGACASICHKGAISIIKNQEGFQQYKLDVNKCVRCGKCKTVCPMVNISALQIKEATTLYSIKSYDRDILKSSSSGGVAHEVASSLLDEGYAVCGCMYDMEINAAKHIWITSLQKNKLALLQGSKYIQSITVDCMKELSNIRMGDKFVFFGTPCQAAAVDKLLKRTGHRDKAIIIDLICHGVPTYYLWENYIKELDKKYGIGNHPRIFFRSNERDWHRRLLRAEGNGHVYKGSEEKDNFYSFFRRNLCLMESCFDCPYRERSAADLRIGDYWGDRFRKDKQGVSMVIAMNYGGEKLIEMLKQKRTCELQKQELSEYWRVQYPYNGQKPIMRKQIICDIKNGIPLYSLRKKYCKYYDFIDRVSLITRKIKRIINKKK